MRGAAFPPSRKSLPDRCLLAFSLLVVALTVLPFFLLCRYNHPGDNDNWWIFRSFLDKEGPDLSLGSAFSLRGTFNFANLFFFPLYRHPEGMSGELFRTFLTVYHLSAAFYVALFWAAASVLYASLNQCVLRFKGGAAFLFYALFLYLLFNAVHYPTMAFYDLVSSSGYNAGVSYLFLFLAFCLWERRAAGKGLEKKRPACLLACILFFYACCFSMEYYPFVCGCFSFAFVLYDCCRRRKANVLHTAFLLVCLAVLARNFLQVRNLVTPDQDGYVGKYTGGSGSGLTLAVTMKDMLQSLRENFVRYFRQLVTQCRYLPSVALLAGGAAAALRREKRALPLWAVLPFFLTILGTCAVFSFATPDLFVMPRYAWTPFVFICLFVLALLTSLALLLLRRFDGALARELSAGGGRDFQQVRDGCIACVRIWREKCRKRGFLLACTAACSLLFSYFALKNANSCVSQAWKDLLKGEAASYDREMTERYAAIFASEPGSPVYLVPIYHRPPSLFVRDSMEVEGGRAVYREFFDNDGICFKVGDLIFR